jgi:tRNA(fMet)-specific endonuclease VapC
MLQYMLDTNICIYVIKNYPAELRERFNQHADQMCISAMTLSELSFGAAKSSRRAENLHAIEQFVALLEILPFTAKAAVHFGQLRAELERAGRPVGAYDMLIAAHARAEGLVVVTNNLREFRRIAGLRTENWI